MLNMRYCGSAGTYQVNYKRISEHVVQITGDFPIHAAGFYLSRINMRDSWDYSKFTTVYREVDDGVQFSDDGSVYPDTSDEIYVPTLRDEVNSLKEEVTVLKDDVQRVNEVLEG